MHQAKRSVSNRHLGYLKKNTTWKTEEERKWTTTAPLTKVTPYSSNEGRWILARVWHHPMVGKMALDLWLLVLRNVSIATATAEDTRKSVCTALLTEFLMEIGSNITIWIRSVNNIVLRLAAWSLLFRLLKHYLHYQQILVSALKMYSLFAHKKILSVIIVDLGTLMSLSLFCTSLTVACPNWKWVWFIL